MEKEITIAHRHWGSQNRRAKITLRNNKVSVHGFSIGYRGCNVIGPKLRDIVDVPKELYKDIDIIRNHRHILLSNNFYNFIKFVWKRANILNPWFNY